MDPASGALEERDRLGIDHAQTRAGTDRAASEDDQAAGANDRAGDRDLAPGGDTDAHDDFAREVRERNARRRHEAAQARVDAAAARDAVATARDLAAVARDKAAAERDLELAVRDAAAVGDTRAVTGAEVLLRAAENRSAAAANRAAAAESRSRSAADREQAARDREQAQADRDALLQQLAIAETDAVTGTRTRAAGLADLDREVDRARRMRGSLVVAIVDVVSLKPVNEPRGQGAGDAVLQRAVREIRSHLRSYDLIVRLEGDEFLCVMSDATVEIACRRFVAVQAALASDAQPCEIRVGFAALEAAESARELVKRADSELPPRRPTPGWNPRNPAALPRSPHVFRSRGA